MHAAEPFFLDRKIGVNSLVDKRLLSKRRYASYADYARGRFQAIQQKSAMVAKD